MPQFSPDQVVFGDSVGMGYWDSSHYHASISSLCRFLHSKRRLFSFRL